MEIERKYLILDLPDQFENFPKKELTQGYLCTSPVVRIRKEDDQYFLTYKNGGMMSREEYNLPLDAESFEHLITKADPVIIRKTRHLIPLDPYLIELDEFHDDFEGLLMAEVEFPSEEEANAFVPPAWFGEEVTFDKRYHNNYMSSHPNWYKDSL